VAKSGKVTPLAPVFGLPPLGVPSLGMFNVVAGVEDLAVSSSAIITYTAFTICTNLLLVALL